MMGSGSPVEPGKAEVEGCQEKKPYANLRLMIIHTTSKTELGSESAPTRRDRATVHRMCIAVHRMHHGIFQANLYVGI